jgi:hypothetical protein
MDAFRNVDDAGFLSLVKFCILTPIRVKSFVDVRVLAIFYIISVNVDDLIFRNLGRQLVH